MNLHDELARLPDHWGLVAVDGNKRAYQKNWQDNPLTKAQAATEIRAGRSKAIGVIAGPASGGLLFIDHDGISATEQLEKLGLPKRNLPRTIAWTSGRDGRFQLAYTIPEQYWPALRNRRVFKTGKFDADGKAENLDLRWAGHYSVIIGAHPDTSGYRWFPNLSPEDIQIAEAPIELIELLLKPTKPDQPLLDHQPTPPPPSLTVLPLLEFISKDSRSLIETGGTPGSWNDDHLRLSLDLQGTENWIRARGHTPDLTASQAFAIHVGAALGLAADFDQKKAWHRFNGAEKHNPHPSTPEESLLKRLSYHTRLSRPIVPQPETSTPIAPRLQTAQPQDHEDDTYAPSFEKPSKLEARELLYMLRKQAKPDRIRYNRFSQSIEINGERIEGAERFYLTLAEQNYKVSKELAMDCLVQVAHENPYDPVALYLEHVADTVEPGYIDGLATGYLRPEDAGKGRPPTLYDHMLRCTLIGAVRRVFEPGCKHDTACVLMGDQGARKSSFWSALGGAFFSDALKDISSKDDLMILHRSWIMEWAELDHITSRKHAGHVKAFLSQSTDLFRVPYGKATEAFPRRGIIVGSTNRSTGFLVDDTGNRRFWVIPTSKTEADPIDTPTLVHERDAIWSAAVHAYRNGDPSHLPTDLAQQVTEENEGYQVENPWTPVIRGWLSARPATDTITTEAILTQAIEKPVERQTRADQMAVADVLRTLGYERQRIMLAGRRQWRWVPTT